MAVIGSYLIQLEMKDGFPYGMPIKWHHYIAHFMIFSVRMAVLLLLTSISSKGPMMTSTLTDSILEIYFNQTDDYDVIADQCDCTVLDVANVLNDYFRGIQ